MIDVAIQTNFIIHSHGLSFVFGGAFFQNCAETKLNYELMSKEDPEQLKSFFHYNYDRKPNLYANLALVFPTGENGNFAKFNIHGMVAPADGSHGLIYYEVQISDEAGSSVCAGDSGVLNADQQNIYFECLGSASLTYARVILTATYNGETETFDASFTK